MAKGGRRWLDLVSTSPRTGDMVLKALLLTAALLALPVAHAFAWGPAGHMAIAIMAYRQLPPPVQARCLAILHAHPKFDKWQEKSADDPPADAAMYIFANASTWPDELRKSGSPYQHDAWHYVDYPLQPPDYPFVAGMYPDNNILFGLDQSEKTLRDPAATSEQRAAALSWIIHLVGDLHQPLHNAELITADYPPPEGDRGGNKFFVSVGGNAINLHAFWDRLPGQAFSPPYAANIATRLEHEFPAAQLRELAKPSDPVAWSLEGRTLAIEKAYLRGKLIGSSDPKALPPPLPPDYLRESKEIADRRLALAGYRLANILDRLIPEVPPENPTPSAAPSPTAAPVVPTTTPENPSSEPKVY